MKKELLTGAVDLFNQNLAEVMMSYSHKVKLSEMEKVSSSRDAEQILRRIWPKDLEYVETFIILLLNRGNKVIGYKIVSTGGVAGTVADPKIIFQTALKTHASYIILAHNHPSGNTRPSDADILLTKSLKEAGIFLQLNIIDHLIIGDSTYFSWADEGLL